jgi:GNAT superfamily N-acetyltransferase
MDSSVDDLADLSQRLQVSRAPEAESKLRAFRCSREAEIQAYLHEDALSDERAGFARTYVVLEDGEIVAYFTLLADSIRLQVDERPEGVRYLSAPAIKIARLGVHDDSRGRRIGEWVVLLVIGLGRELARDVGIRYITLDALPRPRLLEFYAGLGFVPNFAEQSHRVDATGETSIDQSMRFDLIGDPIKDGTLSAGLIAK